MNAGYESGSAADAELRELLRTLCDGSLESAGYERIEQLVQSDQAAADFYIDYLWLHGELHWQVAAPPVNGPVQNGPPAAVPALDYLLAGGELAGGTDDPNAPASAAAAGEQRTPSILGFLGSVLASTHVSPRTMVLMLAGALAGYFLVVMALIPLTRAQLQRGPGEQAASLPTQDGRRTPSDSWQTATPAKRAAAGLAHGQGRAEVGKRYEIAGGRLALRLERGTQLVVEGPAAFRVESSERLHLDHGRLRARVTQPAFGFAVITPVAEVVDLGTEFDVQVAADGKTEVHVVEGAVQVSPLETGALQAGDNVPRSAAVLLAAGRAVRVAPSAAIMPIPFQAREVQLPPVDATDQDGTLRIWLGNLFDDPRGTPLARAIETDLFCAVPEIAGLGIERVIHVGSPLKTSPEAGLVSGVFQPDGRIEIAPHVLFDFANLGWRGRLRGSIANDSYGKFDVLPNGGPLSTRNVRSPTVGTKIEEGIGMHADSLITFDLEQIRAAGEIADRSLEFVCDRIGMNDDEISSRELASFHMVVLVSDEVSVLTANVDGHPVKFDKRAEGWSASSPPTEPMRADGRFPPVRIAISEKAKYLTLVVTSVDDTNSMDHGVWSGARLETIGPSAP